MKLTKETGHLPNNPQPQEEKGENWQDKNWEVLLGINWFSRIGIFALLMGLAMALSHTFPIWKHILTPEVKIIASGLCSLGLFFGGRKLHENYNLLGRILQGGGLSLGYLTLFAMFFIPEVQLFQEATIGWSLLTIYVGTMIWLSTRLNSITVAVISLIFGFYTSLYSGAQFTALFSTFLLSTAGVCIGKNIVLNNQDSNWSILYYITILGSLFQACYWSMHLNFGHHASIAGIPEVLFNYDADMQIFLWGSYLLFGLSNFFPIHKLTSNNIAANVMNTGGFYLIYKVMFGTCFYAGVLEGAIALFHGLQVLLIHLQPKSDHKESLSYYLKVNLLMCISYTTLGMFDLFDAQVQSLALAVQALVLGYLSKQALSNQSGHKDLYKLSSYIILGLAYFSLLFFNWSSLVGLALIPLIGCIVLVTTVLEANVYHNDDNTLKIGLGLMAFFTLLSAFLTALSSHWLVVAFIITGFIFMTGGFVTLRKKYRMLGLIWLTMAAVHFVFIDLMMMDTVYKIISLITMGVTMLAGSYAYNRLESQIMEQHAITEQTEGLHPYVTLEEHNEFLQQTPKQT